MWREDAQPAVYRYETRVGALNLQAIDVVYPSRNFHRRIMKNFLLPRTARIALSAAAALFTTFAGSGVAQTPFSTGGVEVRGFYGATSTIAYAASYGGGLYRSTDAGASWTRTALPGNARYMTSVAGNSNTLVAGADEGLFRRGDGTTYTKILSESVSAVAASTSPSSTVLAGVKGLGVVRSTDNGLSFVVANNSAFDSSDIAAIAFHPTNANIAYAAATPNGLHAGGGVFRSTDGGATWASYNANLTTPTDLSGLGGGNYPNTYVSSLAVDTADTVYAGVLRFDGLGDLFTRASGAPSWTATGDFFGVVSVHRDANAGTTIYGGNRTLGLLRGSGTVFNYTYNQTGAPNLLATGINAVGTLPGSSVVLMANRGAGVWRSTVMPTMDADWTRVIFPGADRVLSASNVGSSETTMLAGLYAGGAWRSNDSGGTWNPPTVNAGQADFSVGPGNTAVRPFASIWDLSASPSNANLIYAAVGGVGMFYYNDVPAMFRWNGTSWGAIGANAPVGAPWNGNNEAGVAISDAEVFGISLDRVNENVVYAGYLVNPGIFIRSNAGTWSFINPPGVTVQTRKIVTSATPGKLLALEFDDKPAISFNSGASWPQQVTINQMGFERIRFFQAAESPTNANLWVAGTNKGVFFSTDGGSNWSRVTTMASVFQQMPIPAVGFRADGRAFAGDWAGNRYCSTNGGQTWVLMPGGPMRAGINAIRNIGTGANNLYYLTDGAGFYREDGTC